MSQLHGDDILYTKDRWMILKEWGEIKTTHWIVHRCLPEWRPVYMLNIEKCYVCGMEMPESIQTIWLLLK